MLNKLYSKIIKFLKNNITKLLIIIFLLVLFNFKLPYYIEKPGDLKNLNHKIIVENEYESKGTLNLTYVLQKDATIFNYIESLFEKNSKLIKKEKNVEENIQNLNKQSILSLKNSYNTACYVANKKNNNKDILNNFNYYISNVENINTNLEIGDKIISIDGYKIEQIEQIKEIIGNYESSIEIEIIVNENEKKFIKLENGKLGISVIKIYDCKNVKFDFKNNESGGSGGLMIALSIYDKLIKTDLTGGKKIAGTGTIDIKGNNGDISGVSYKLIGAAKNKADIFFVPKENYNEALVTKNENKLNIEIVEVNTFDDALNYLLNNVHN